MFGYATCLALFSTPDHFSLCCRSERGDWTIHEHASMYKSRALFAYIHFFSTCSLSIHFITPWWQMFQNQHIGPRSILIFEVSVQDCCNTFLPLALSKRQGEPEGYRQSQKFGQGQTGHTRHKDSQSITENKFYHGKQDLDPVESFFVAF